MTATPRTVISLNGRPIAGHDEPPPVIGSTVVVNGETIDPRAIAAEVQNHEAPRGRPGVAWTKAVNALVVRILLLAEARRRGVTAKPVEVGPGRFETEDEALIRGLLEVAVEVDPPNEADVRAEWARNPDRFRTPPLWEVSHILVACDPRDAGGTEAARARAADLIATVLVDPARFARVAADHSDCGSRSSGGALGQVGPGDTVPEFEAALHRLGEREITRVPVQSRHGWHIIRMDAAATGAVLPYEAVRRKILDAMQKAAWSRSARSYVQQLVASAEISGASLLPSDGGQAC